MSRITSEVSVLYKANTRSFQAFSHRDEKLSG